MLPAYTTPESYLENYMPQDFSKVNQITNMRFLGYENNQNFASAYASYIGFLASGKSMHCSFEVNGIPAQGALTIVTNELAGYGTAVKFLGRIFAPADQFDAEAPMLVGIWNSIKVMPQYRDICTPPIGGSGCIVCNDNDCCQHQCDAEGNCN